MTPSKSSILIGLLAIYIGYMTHQVHQMDTKYEQWNNDEWHIDQFSRPAFPIRFINAHHHHYGNNNKNNNNNMVMNLMQKFAVKPALDKVLSLMQQADTDDIVPKILCDTHAQTDLTKRVDEFYTDIQHSTSLTYMGKVFLYATSIMSLTNHHGLLTLGMKEEVQLRQTIKEPVFIASLPRTGSTILHRTMALDTSRFRNFDLADMVVPLPQPIPRWDNIGRAQKATEANGLLTTMKWIYPGLMECLETMHGFRPSEADEDLGWYDSGLGHFYMDPLMKLYPVYRKKEETIESKEVARYRYAWLAMIIKIYQYTDDVEWNARKQREGRAFLRQHAHSTSKLPWLMKDPNHSAYLPELLEQFPDAKLIFTHRNPGEVVPSLAKLFVMFTSPDFIPGSEGTSAKEWGEETLKRMDHYSSGLVDFTRDQNNNSNNHNNNEKSSPYSFPSTSTSRIDLSFVDVRWDVPGAIETIYKQFYPDQPHPSNMAKRAFKTYLEQNEREKHGNQRRSLEDFHLTEDDVAFREYNDMFLN